MKPDNKVVRQTSSNNEYHSNKTNLEMMLEKENAELKARISELEKAIQQAIDDDDSWGCDVTMQLMLSDALKDKENV